MEPAPEPILTVRGVSKHFGGVQALREADLALRPGEVHVLMGSNGSGKSTLCRVIAGALGPDGGEFSYRGAPVRFARPALARKAGIAVVYQETSLIPTLTVEENILLGTEPRLAGIFIGRAARRRRVEALLDQFGREAHLRVGLRDRVGDLDVDQRQLVEILKVLATDAKVIIFDEATSSLDKAQVEVFFGLVRRLRADGKAVVFISHRMEEVFAIGDRVTVLRNGRTVFGAALPETNRAEIIGHMVGGADLAAAAKASSRRVSADVVLRVDGLVGPKVRGVSFELHRGEILGLGGLHGQGQSDLLLTLFGAVPRSAGRVELRGKTVRLHSPTEAIRHRVAYLSGDRGKAGVFGIRPIFENLIISRLVRSNRLFIRPQAARQAMAPFLEALKVKYASLSQPVQSLSGGNQQKVLVSRWLATGPEVLLLDDPTKGIDVRAKEDLYELMARLCAEGAAIILYSSEDLELLANADRVLVFNSGQAVDELRDGRMTEYHLYAAALASTAA